jgi:hypothetical protein
VCASLQPLASGLHPQLRKRARPRRSRAARLRWQVLLWNVVSYNNSVRGDAVAVEMRRATERALALDPNLSDAHGAKGWTTLTLDWDWKAAAAEAQKAYDLDPTQPSNAILLGSLLWRMHGASDTVLALYQKAIDLDPVASYGYGNIGDYYTGTGKLPEAETAIEKRSTCSRRNPLGIPAWVQCCCYAARQPRHWRSFSATRTRATNDGARPGVLCARPQSRGQRGIVGNGTRGCDDPCIEHR